MNKPALQSVVDLGLRDVGVENDRRRLGAHFGKTFAKQFAVIFLSGFVSCAVLGATGARWLVLPLALLWTTALVVLALRSARRSPVIVVRVTAEGSGQAMWVLLLPFLSLAVLAAWAPRALLLPVIALTAIMGMLVWRNRGRLPELLREFRPVLAADETVVGDGIGTADGARGWDNAFRLVVATDRRLLVAGSPRKTGRLVLADVPYEGISRFGIEWKYLGRFGTLSLTLAGGDGEPLVINAIAPANLVSIAQALQSHGVATDDAAAVAEAVRAWNEVLQRAGAPEAVEPRKRLFDRAAMNTGAYDRGLWLLLGLSAIALYNPLVASAAAFVVILLVGCGVSGYVSGTRASVAYLVPLNLLVSPSFFYLGTGSVIGLMITLSLMAAAALWAGSRLREARDPRASAPTAADSEARPARGSLRYALSGLGLIRLTGMVLAGMLFLVASAGAAGIELNTLRLALDELRLKQVPVDGRSNLTGNAASITYTPGPDLHEFITDNVSPGSETDGVRWELRSSFRKGYNVVSLAHYVKEPRLDNPDAIADFVARKDREHEQLAGFDVTHTERTVAGRKGYVWNHGSRDGYWYYAAWFPQPVHTVRVECIAKNQKDRFKRLCDEAVRSLEFRQ